MSTVVYNPFSGTLDYVGAASTSSGTSLARGRLKVGATTYLVVPGRDVGALTTNVIGADLLMIYEPWLIHTAVTVDQIVTEVTTAATAGKLIRLGIYNASVDWQPTTLVLDAGTVAADSTGVKAVSISQALPAGRYLGVFFSNGQPTVRAYRAGGEIGFTTGTTGNVSQLTKTMATFDPLAASGVAADTVGAAAGSNTFLHRVFVRVSVP